jgi:hypothetical protein
MGMEQLLSKALIELECRLAIALTAHTFFFIKENLNRVLCTWTGGQLGWQLISSATFQAAII